MSVLIRGMEMPQSCLDCEFEAPTIDHHECCILTKKSYNWGLTTRPSDCPIVSVPPHGRLIDADVLQTDYFVPSTASGMPNYYYVSKKQIDEAQTIIPAEPLKEEEK